MEDAGLDDFFAKKDKSKKKSKSSKVTPTDIINKTDEPVKKEKKKKDKDKSQTAANTANNTSSGLTQDEEWKEVEEEKEKDYSGLRIANLQVSEKPESENDEQAGENEEEEGDDGEVKEKKDAGQQGPWKASGGAPPPKPVIAPEPVPEPPKEEPKSTGKYIPPSQRGAAAAGATGASSGPTIPAHLRKKKNAPNIKSEEDFPTLGGGPMPVDSDTRSFERVQYGGRQTDNPGKDTQQLSLGNKFSALQD